MQVDIYLALAVSIRCAELLPGIDGHGLAAGPVGDAGALVSLAVADLGEQLEHGHAVGRLVVLKGGDHARRLGNAQALRKLRLGHHGGILPQFVHIGAGGLVTHDVRRRGSRAVKGTAATGRGGDDGGIHIFHSRLLKILSGLGLHAGRELVTLTGKVVHIQGVHLHEGRRFLRDGPAVRLQPPHPAGK